MEYVIHAEESVHELHFRLSYPCYTFFFLTGDQLYFKESAGNTQLPVAQTGTVELYAGNVVDQHFIAQVDRLEKSMSSGEHFTDPTPVR